MEAAISNYAKIYASYLQTITVGGSKEIALQFAVQDMINQVKHYSQEHAALYINEEASYLEEKMKKVIA